MKRIIAIILVLGLFSSAVYGASTLKNISVAPNYATIKVDGKVITADNFIYNGTTYVPLRAISENLSCTVDWDQKTKTASITSKINIGGGSAGTGLSAEGVRDLNDILKNMYDYMLLANMCEMIILHADEMLDWYGEGGVTPEESEKIKAGFSSLKRNFESVDNSLKGRTPQVLSIAQKLEGLVLELESTALRIAAKESLNSDDPKILYTVTGRVSMAVTNILYFEIHDTNMKTLKKLIEITE